MPLELPTPFKNEKEVIEFVQDDEEISKVVSASRTWIDAHIEDKGAEERERLQERIVDAFVAIYDTPIDDELVTRMRQAADALFIICNQYRADDRHVDISYFPHLMRCIADTEEFKDYHAKAIEYLKERNKS